jgi:hypothetical protein
MAWSPPARQRRSWLVEQAGDYATHIAHHTRDGTMAKAMQLMLAIALVLELVWPEVSKAQNSMAAVSAGHLPQCDDDRRAHDPDGFAQNCLTLIDNPGGQFGRSVAGFQAEHSIGQDHTLYLRH